MSDFQSGYLAGKDLGLVSGDLRQLANMVQQLAQQVQAGERRVSEMKAMNDRLDRIEKRINELADIDKRVFERFEAIEKAQAPATEA